MTELIGAMYEELPAPSKSRKAQRQALQEREK